MEVFLETDRWSSTYFIEEFQQPRQLRFLQVGQILLLFVKPNQVMEMAYEI